MTNVKKKGCARCSFVKSDVGSSEDLEPFYSQAVDMLTTRRAYSKSEVATLIAEALKAGAER